RRLLVPATRPPDRMANWLVGGIAADESRREIARVFELPELVLAFRRLLEPVMNMELVARLAGLGIRPFAAGTHDDRCRAEQLFKLCARFLRVRVTFDAECGSLREVLLACPLVVREHRDRRAEHDRLGIVCGTAGVVFGDLKHELQAASERRWRDPERLAFVALVERSDRDKSLVRCMAKECVDENF